MSKYIPAEKLIAEIERYKKGAAIARFDNAGENGEYFQGKVEMCDDLTHIIASLQQEPRFPQYDNIVEKIFGAGNLEGWEFRDAEMLVALAKEELLKSIRQEQPDLPSGEDVMTMCNQILVDWVKEGKTQEEKEQREQAHIRFFELYDDYLMQEQPEVDLEKELDEWRYKHFKGKRDSDYNGEYLERESQLDIASHFWYKGYNAKKANSKNEVLKDLPRWKKYNTPGMSKGVLSLTLYSGVYEVSDLFIDKGLYIPISDLEKLPGFKKD